MSEPEAMLKQVEKINYKSQYLDNLDRKYLEDNDKDKEMSNVKYISPINDHFISECTTSI